MKKPIISIVAAIDKNLGIGKDNGLIFHASLDMKRFRDLTRGHVVIMGRKQFESKEQGGKPLPNKINIVISRNKNFNASGAIIVDSISQALKKARELEKEEIFIIGGGEIFKQTIDMVDKLYLTLVDANLNAQVFFPEYLHKFSKVVFEEEHEENGLKFKFVDYQK